MASLGAFYADGSKALLFHHGGGATAHRHHRNHRGGLAVLAGGEEQASQGQVSLSTCTPPFQGEVEYRCCRLGTLIATQTKAPLLLGPGPGQPASQRRGGEARRRRPVQEARDDSW